jgi:hypothetical protein
MLGHLAVEGAASPEVKAMGATMVEKHSALGQELKEVGDSDTPAKHKNDW